MSTMFEIKVAFLGNVNAGKTTVLNALLGDNYSQVSMKCTTAAANYFRIFSSTNPVATQICPNAMVPNTVSPGRLQKLRSAKSILTEITEDNQVKITEGNDVTEKYFDVEVSDKLVTCRNDVNLVLVDIPGINEAGTANEYKEYVSAKWETFDCVVLVMDGKAGVNTDEQVFLLDFVKENILTKRAIPIIVLCNKIDDPEDEEQEELVIEARAKVEEKLGEGNCQFIPVSAIQYFIQRCCSKMTLEQFRQFDSNMIEKFGREQVGLKVWKKLSTKERIQEAYKVVTDQDYAEESFQRSNFDKFIPALERLVCGKEKNFEILVNKLKLEAKELFSNFWASDEFLKRLNDHYDHSLAIYDIQDLNFIFELIESFSSHFEKCEDLCFANLEEKWPYIDIQEISDVMDYLTDFFNFLREKEIQQGYNKVQTLSTNFVKNTINFFIGKRMVTTNSNIHNYTQDLTQDDWSLIWGSMLLHSHNEYFIKTLGEERILLETLRIRDSVLQCLPYQNNHDIQKEFIGISSKKRRRIDSPTKTGGITNPRHQKTNFQDSCMKTERDKNEKRRNTVYRLSSRFTHYPKQIGDIMYQYCNLLSLLNEQKR